MGPGLGPSGRSQAPAAYGEFSMSLDRAVEPSRASIRSSVLPELEEVLRLVGDAGRRGGFCRVAGSRHQDLQRIGGPTDGWLVVLVEPACKTASRGARVSMGPRSNLGKGGIRVW